MVSKKHNNRRAYNWLVYDIGDRMLQRYSNLYRGSLYDLGCGEAPYREFFLQYALQYVGVDWASSPHQTRAEITADLNGPLPIDSGVADTVVSLSVLEHLSQPQIMLEEAFRILRPGGSILIQVPWQWQIHEAPHDFFRYTPHGLKFMLERAGFVAVTIEPQGGFFTTMVMKCNYFSCRFVGGNSVLRSLLRVSLVPLWYIGQKVAPMLDRLDKSWELEACGFYAVATKS